MSPAITVPDLGSIAELILRFGRVDRATRHPDGIRPESDTDHTVMLAVLALEIAHAHPEADLRPGLLAELALAHDLVEAYAGDTDTAGGLNPDAKAAKAYRETRALAQIRTLGTRWIERAITVYERQDTPEARFLRYLDKITPKLTHTLNGCATARQRGRSLQSLREDHQRQGAELRAQYPEWADLLGPLFDAASAACENAMDGPRNLAEVKALAAREHDVGCICGKSRSWHMGLSGMGVCRSEAGADVSRTGGYRPAFKEPASPVLAAQLRGEAIADEQIENERLWEENRRLRDACLIAVREEDECPELGCLLHREHTGAHRGANAIAQDLARGGS